MTALRSFASPLRDSIECLGTCLDKVGSAWASYAHRVGKAEACDGRIRRHLCNRSATISSRVNAWSQGPATSCIFGAEDWPMSQWMSKRIKAWENRHFRAFMKWKRMPGELNQGYMDRTDDRVQKLLLQSKTPYLFHRIFRLQHRWIREIHEFITEDGKRPLKSLLFYRTDRMFEASQALAQGSREAHRDLQGEWRHRTEGTNRNDFTAVFLQVYGSDWMDFL